MFSLPKRSYFKSKNKHEEWQENKLKELRKIVQKEFL